MSYSQVALLVGRPGAARAVGNVLAGSHGLPWWRVVTQSGRLVPGLEIDHARRLAGEGCEAMPVPGPQPALARAVRPLRRHRGSGRAPRGGSKDH